MRNSIWRWSELQNGWMSERIWESRLGPDIAFGNNTNEEFFGSPVSLLSSFTHFGFAFITPCFNDQFYYICMGCHISSFLNRTSTGLFYILNCCMCLKKSTLRGILVWQKEHELWVREISVWNTALILISLSLGKLHKLWISVSWGIK